MKIYNQFKNIVEENISQGFILENINETRKYFLEEVKQNEFMNKKHKIRLYNSKLASRINKSISISPFAFFLGISIEITSFAIGLKVCAITAGIKKYKSAKLYC